MDGSADQPRPTYIDPSLARGLVRHEARQLRDAHEQIRHIPDELYRVIVDRFKGRRRLSASNLKLLAGEIDRKASSALSSICSSMTQRTPSRFRPGSVRYDIVHYVVGAVEQSAVAGRTPMDRIMRLCVFAARLDQREVAMSFRELPLCFWEHAARRYLVRGGGEHDAAVRSIARRLATTYILPALAVRATGGQANGSPLAIPFAGGLLLGRFQAEPKIDNSGGHVTFNKYCMRNHTVFYPTPTNFVVRTYVNPKLLRPEQHEIVREMEAWLAAHQAEAEAAVMQYHRLEDNDQGEFLDSASWATLQADFQALWTRLSAQL